MAGAGGGGNDIQWCFSQVKGAVDDDVAEEMMDGEPVALQMLLSYNSHHPRLLAMLAGANDIQ